MLNSETFLQRSDLLAEKLRLNVEELALKLRISRASFWGYRTGKRAISQKAWRKLEEAERLAGIATNETNPKDSRSEMQQLLEEKNYKAVFEHLSLSSGPEGILKAIQALIVTATPKMGAEETLREIISLLLKSGHLEKCLESSTSNTNS